jgi:hypothetical protein
MGDGTFEKESTEKNWGFGHRPLQRVGPLADNSPGEYGDDHPVQMQIGLLM